MAGLPDAQIITAARGVRAAKIDSPSTDPEDQPRPGRADASSVVRFLRRLQRRADRNASVPTLEWAASHLPHDSEDAIMFGMTSSEETNALDLLKNDHQQVDRMFKEYEETKDGADDTEKEQLVTQICDALTVHAQIEEEIFYPAARRALDEQEGRELLDEAAVEHQTLKDLIGRLEAAPTDDPLYDAGVKVLSEYVKHHVKEEENELFPKLKSAEVDLDALGAELAKRKEQLTKRQATRARESGNGERRASRMEPSAGSRRDR
jgi:hemerythrin superfamily protein